VDLGQLATGVVVGFVVAAGVGPISLLTIRRTVSHGRPYGLASGLGVATADASYAAVAAFGMTAISGLVVAGRAVLGAVGGAIIVALGLRTMLVDRVEVAAAAERPGLVGAAISIYALTMTNPMTILSFAALFAGFGFGAGTKSFGDAAALTLGVWLGSSLWWVLLTSVVAWLRGKVSSRVLAWINRLSGAALVAFGAIAIGVALGVI